MKILITGSRGFIGKNLTIHLKEVGGNDVLTYNRDDPPELLPALISQADAIIHLAGEMRPLDDRELFTSNVGLTETVCDLVKGSGRVKTVVLASSIQADQDNPYGQSKLEAEQRVVRLSKETGVSGVVYRLPHVFGKWGKPNYNSVISTFCYNAARGIPLKINDPSAMIMPVHIDDVVSEFARVISNPIPGFSAQKVLPEYKITIGELAALVVGFKESRVNLTVDRVGNGLVRALYSTYVSFLPEDSFTYNIPCHCDASGVFVEFVKTLDSGQFSYFTLAPGVTRGEHYHQTRIEKFLVVSGKACFCFRNLIDNKNFEIIISDNKPCVVESIPGWAHNITIKQ